MNVAGKNRNVQVSVWNANLSFGHMYPRVEFLKHRVASQGTSMLMSERKNKNGGGGKWAGRKR